MPGFTPHEAKDSECRRGLSHSERDWGDAKLWRRGGRAFRLLWLFFEGVVVRDMAGIFRKRRGKGQRLDPMLAFEDETRKHTDRAVRRRSGREGRLVSGCGGVGNISTAACGGGPMRRVGTAFD